MTGMKSVPSAGSPSQGRSSFCRLRFLCRESAIAATSANPPSSGESMPFSPSDCPSWKRGSSCLTPSSLAEMDSISRFVILGLRLVAGAVSSSGESPASMLFSSMSVAAFSVGVSSARPIPPATTPSAVSVSSPAASETGASGSSFFFLLAVFFGSAEAAFSGAFAVFVIRWRLRFVPSGFCVPSCSACSSRMA